MNSDWTMSSNDDNQNPLLRVEKWAENHSIHSKKCPTASNNGSSSTSKDQTTNNHVSVVTEEDCLDPEEQCASFSCSRPPAWMQRLATKNMFLLVFCLSSVIQGMYYTYFVSVLSTTERLFQIKSKTTGIIMSATEVGQIGGGLLLSYYGGGGHRPRWIAGGMLLFGFSAFLCSLPHFLFGKELLRNALASIPSAENPIMTANLCYQNNDTSSSDFISEVFPNMTHSNSSNNEEECEAYNPHSNVVLLIFFVALLGVGLGQTAVYNLGIPYLDDNVASEESPTYFGTTIGVRIFGPTLGFVLGSMCTRIAVDPFSPSQLEPTDPRWIGAWWLGHLIISFALIIMSSIMMLFPKRLPQKAADAETTTRFRLTHDARPSEKFEDTAPLTEKFMSLDSSSFPRAPMDKFKPLSGINDPSWVSSDKPNPLQFKSSSLNHLLYPEHDLPRLKWSPSMFDASSFADNDSKQGCDHFAQRHRNNPTFVRNAQKRSLKDFTSVLRRLLSNRILLLRTASSVLHLLPISGLYTFLPKYLETQFRLPVHSAAMIAGVGGIMVMGLGIFSSGFIIRRLNPSPRTIAAWIACTAFLYTAGMVILVFLGCSHSDIKGRIEINGISNFHPICETSCTTNCNTDFAPICSSEGNTYFSACHAGCKAVSFENNTESMMFSDCDCLGDDVTAILRLCEKSCPNLKWYVLVFCIFVIIHSTSEVGGMLLTLRCVDPQDKAMAIGLISVAVGLFGNVPCPIIYGAIIDYACINWRESCDGSGACQLYDEDTFRTLFHGVTAFVMFLAFCVDTSTWHFCKGVTLPGDSTDKPAPASDTSPYHSNPPSTTLTIDRNELESLASSSTSPPHRKRELRHGDDDNGSQSLEDDDSGVNRDKALSNPVILDALRRSCDIPDFPVRESVI